MALLFSFGAPDEPCRQRSATCEAVLSNEDCSKINRIRVGAFNELAKSAVDIARPTAPYWSATTNEPFDVLFTLVKKSVESRCKPNMPRVAKMARTDSSHQPECSPVHPELDQRIVSNAAQIVATPIQPAINRHRSCPGGKPIVTATAAAKVSKTEVESLKLNQTTARKATAGQRRTSRLRRGRTTVSWLSVIVFYRLICQKT
jgi:hypothetical protein